MDLRQLFATNLRRLRHARKLSQETLAHDAGIDRVYLGRVERAATYVGLEIIEKLSRVLDVDASEFFQRPTRKRQLPTRAHKHPSSFRDRTRGSEK